MHQIHTFSLARKHFRFEGTHGESVTYGFPVENFTFNIRLYFINYLAIVIIIECFLYVIISHLKPPDMSRVIKAFSKLRPELREDVYTQYQERELERTTFSAKRTKTPAVLTATCQLITYGCRLTS